ncbi:lactonase family protein [Ferruginibacter sp.]|uniref:lactonase family protein n=1 Tax=Ferruginibacter sp. TaxID=1940288 RepID=UPI00374D8870
MKKMSFFKISVAAAILVSFTACKKNNDHTTTNVNNAKTGMEEMISEKGANPDEASITQTVTLANTGNRERGDDDGHYLYTESNTLGTNCIIGYKIKKDGTLQWQEQVLSGGSGTGKSLGSQGALVIDKEHEWLYAVNAGCNSVSSFKIDDKGKLTLAHSADVDGKTPVSVTVHKDLLYVLNRATDNIQGFKIGSGGMMTPIEGSMQPLSSTGVDAPQISFTPNGDWIIVTEKATNIIGTFKVKNDGSVNAGTFTASVGKTPFGFDFSRNYMIVSNAAGGMSGAGSSTSYTTYNGKPAAINGAVASEQAAPCWIATTKYGRFAYVTNTASNNISSYYVSPWGGLYLVHGEAAKTDNGPIDIVVSKNNYDVYELNGKSNTIGWYQRKPFGELILKGTATNLPLSTVGLATY